MRRRRYFALSWRHVLLAAILLLAALLRLWRLSDLPPGLYHDEAYNGLDALSLVQGKTFPQFYEGWELYAQDAHAERPAQESRFPLFFEGNYGREPLHVYLMALSIWLFGPTPFALRLVPALAGVLGVWTTYLAATAVCGGWRAAQDDPRHKGEPSSQFPALISLLAALAVAIFVPSIHFSRFGLRVMLFVPLSTLTVYTFWRGVNAIEAKYWQTEVRSALPQRMLRSQEVIQDLSALSTVNLINGTQSIKPRNTTDRSGFVSFIAAGFFLGLGIYTYAAARLLPLLFVLFIPYWFWCEREAARHAWRSVALMAGISLLVAAPLLLFFYRYPYYFVFRIAYVANRGKGAVAGRPWQTWLLNVGRVFRGLFWYGETHLRHNLPGRPFLDPIQAGLTLLGSGVLARRRLHVRAVFLWLWLAVTLLPSILSGDAPHFGRLSGAAPVLAILLALGASWLSKRFSVFSKRLSGNNYRLPITVPWLLITFLLSSSLFLTVRDYFGRYAGHPQLTADFYLHDWELGQYAAALPLETNIYLTPTQEEMATIYFALADPGRLRSYTASQTLIPAGSEGVAAVYLLRPDQAAALANLQTLFDSGRAAIVQHSFTPFHVPPAAPRIAVAMETAVPFAEAIMLRGWSVAQTGDQLQVTLAWQAQTQMSEAYTAFVHLLDSGGQLITQVDRPPAGYPTTDWQPGEIVVDTFTLSLPDTLPPGEYRLQTGFYALPGVIALGETAVLTDALSLP